MTTRADHYVRISDEQIVAVLRDAANTAWEGATGPHASKEDQFRAAEFITAARRVIEHFEGGTREEVGG